MREVSVCNGKYRFQYEEKTAQFTCLRYGQEWRDFLGDNAVWYLFEEVCDLKQQLKEQKELYEALAKATGNV